MYEATTSLKMDKQALKDLKRVKEELDLIVESLELTADKDFMASYKKSKSQIGKREFVKWDAL